jgi:uncharacterized membrane protein
VAALAVAGAAFLSGRPRLIRPVLIGFSALCLAVWVLVQDLGFLGGVGTDPNSMIPLILLATAGYLAVARVPAARPLVPGTGGPLVPGTGGPPVPAAAVAESRSAWRARIRPAELYQQVLNASARSLVAAGAAGLVLLGAVPLALAQASASADPILAQSPPAAGATAPNRDEAYVIDRTGHVAQIYRTVPAPGTAAMASSFAALLAGAARQALSTP